MASNRFNDSVSSGLGMDVADRRAAFVRAEQERLDARRAKLDALTSPFTAPEERIRLWEALYGLQLPRGADHRLVRVIAQNTALSVPEVHAEQRRRAAI